MAVAAAVRSNPVLRNFFANCGRAEKYFKSALTACMRKLLVILNVVLRCEISWQTHLRSPPPLQPFGPYRRCS